MPSQTGIDYLLPIFTDAIGEDDMEVVRAKLFAPGSLTHAYRSINTDIQKRIRYVSAPT
jgi:6-phosphofructokinase 1